MDASAILKGQGWRGKGFSLHPTNSSVGLAKPLLLSRNTDGRGIGTKPHYTSDQWWLHAFDQKLKGLDTSKKGMVVQSETKGKLDAIATGYGKYSGASGLYASFVSGGMLEGTLTPDSGESTDATPVSDVGERTAHPQIVTTQKETKEERRLRRAAKRLRKAEKAARKAAEAKRERKAAEKAARKAQRDSSTAETKEERKARRAERRARKEVRRRRREERSSKRAEGG